MFLLVRGDFAWIGYSWDGCTEAIDAYEVPPILNADFGAPVDANCRETAPGSGVFERRFANAVVSLNCSSFMASFTFAPQ